MALIKVYRNTTDTCCFTGALQYSFSWFIRPFNFTMPGDIGGSTEVSYFESGDGSSEKPYVISSPVHLYNLAWLQYLGYFNLGDNINNGLAQSYFVLKNDIDMDGIAIPPIGTEEYPFLGNFNGQGYTIANCVTANSNQLQSALPLPVVTTILSADTASTNVRG